MKILRRLARKLLCDLCANTIEFIKKIILSPEFIDRHRQHKTDFTRQKKLPFHVLIVFLINFVKGSYQDELDKFFKTLLRCDVAQRVVSKAALSKARMKLKFEAFVELNRHLVSHFEDKFNPHKWCGFRLLGIDGLTTRLPIIEAISDHFGVMKGRQGEPSPMARVSQMFDVLNKISVDAIIKPKSIGERELASEHLMNITSNDLILLDRGYPAWWLFRLILSKNGNFCARISCTKWKAIRKFYRSGLAEKIIELPVHPTSVAKCKKLGLDMTPLKLRLVRIQNQQNVAVLVTSLLDTEKYPNEVFNDLYHRRWPVEEDYKVMKCRLELENFSGKSLLSVYQDFHAKVFLKNLVTIMAFPVNQILNEENDTKKYDYQINFTQALSKSKGVIALLFNENRINVAKLIAQLQTVFQKTIEPIRPGRTQPRKHKIKPRKFFPQYKPIG
jgi:hypothetical protein